MCACVCVCLGAGRFDLSFISMYGYSLNRKYIFYGEMCVYLYHVALGKWNTFLDESLLVDCLFSGGRNVLLIKRRETRRIRYLGKGTGREIRTQGDRGGRGRGG